VLAPVLALALLVVPLPVETLLPQPSTRTVADEAKKIRQEK
jgi:hypothetical protein